MFKCAIYIKITREKGKNGGSPILDNETLEILFVVDFFFIVYLILQRHRWSWFTIALTENHSNRATNERKIEEKEEEKKKRK